jgi:hypothetical protein
VTFGKAINHSYEAIISTKVPEDRCTNILIWMLQKIAPYNIAKIFSIDGTSFRLNSLLAINARVQFPLENSRPDAILTLHHENCVSRIIIETKIVSNDFDCDQFRRHIVGAQKAFSEGERQILIFLSTDVEEPTELRTLNSYLKSNQKVHFISWKTVVRNINNFHKEEYEYIPIAEFLGFVSYMKLEEARNMTTDDKNEFVESFIKVRKFESIYTSLMNSLISRQVSKIVEENKLIGFKPKTGSDEQQELPLLFQSFTLTLSNTKYSCYFYINAYSGRMGILFAAYECDDTKKVKFLNRWKNSIKAKIKNVVGLEAFTWKEEIELKQDVFFRIDSSITKKDDPSENPETENYLYLGFSCEISEDDSILEGLRTKFISLVTNRLLVDKK